MAVEVRETDPVTSSSSFYKRGYYQRSARRANGDTVFITGDFQWKVEEVRRLLMKTARKSRLRMIEIAEIAGLTEMASPRSEEEECLQTQLAVVEAESVELPTINNRVPAPGDDVDLALAMEEFRWDIERCAELAFDTSLETVAAVAQNTYRWARFWVVRHPNPEVRGKFAAALGQVEPIRAGTKEKADRLIAKRRARLDG